MTTPSAVLTPVKVLRDAAELLETRGWGKARFYDPRTDCFCADGALMAAGGVIEPLTVEESQVLGMTYRPTPGGNGREAYSEAFEAARQRTLDLWNSGLINWNDEIAETKEQVIDLFNEVADALEASDA